MQGIKGSFSICSIDDCNNKMHAKGLCKKHYDAEINRNRTRWDRPVCKVEGCKNLIVAKHGLCRKHVIENMKE